MLGLCPRFGLNFKSIGHRLAFGRSVDDKFPVKSSAGSFRGKSSGVAVSSVLPVFSFEDERVSACVWASCRLVHSVVQCGHLPIHVLVAYLHPCAYVGSEKHEINSRILAAAACLLEGLHGPALLVGDWNAPADTFEPVRMLQEQFGYRDVAVMCSDRDGGTPAPTCKGATRHSFIFASPDATRFVQSCWVGAHFDLDAHSVLFARFAFPNGNPSVLKWLAPASLDAANVDVEAANEAAPGVADTFFESVAVALDQDDLDKAIAVWSGGVESHLLEHACPSLPAKRYKGRCQRCDPRSVRLGPPRLKGGRPGDFSPSVYAGTVQVRQWTKQVRRLRCFQRACLAVDEGRGKPGLLHDRFRLWDACVRATGFPHGFLSWVSQQGFATPVVLPDASWTYGVLHFLEGQTQSLATRTAADKSGHFLGVLEESWAAGGSLPLRLLREPQAPEVLELEMKVPVKLAPQKWLPCGKAWLKLLNAHEFRPGDQLVGDLSLKVVAVQAPYISVSQAVSRRTAASLSKSWIEADPSVWSQHVLDQWNVFWQRDADEGLPVCPLALRPFLTLSLGLRLPRLFRLTIRCGSMCSSLPSPPL